MTAGDWFERVEAILLDRFMAEPARGATAAAEAGLALPPCAYWYLCRTDARFGFVVFLWREDDAAPLLAGEGFVVPFDTGGLWHGYIHTAPAMTAPERQAFVATHSRPISDWLPELTAWLGTKYAARSQYVLGKPPTAGLPGIVYDSSNEAAAWTWEARLRKSSYRRQITLQHIFWSAADRRAFEDWLETRHMDDRDAAELLERIAAMSIETPPGERATEEVVRHLLGII